ncbi:MAG: hypothetical protein IJ685_07800 [Selenomonadaceae bacterium]|nr:hypothetical protein [Selenomonadaceae bacterium]
MRKIFILLTTLLILSSSVDAAKVDIYRDALRNKTFTLKYEMVEVPIIETSKDATYSSTGLKKKEFYKSWFNKLHNGILVMSGADIYSEQFRDDFIMKRTFTLFGIGDNEPKFKEGGHCSLVKNGETFVFGWDKKDGKRHYFGFKNVTKQLEEYKKYLTPYQKLVEDCDVGMVKLAGGAFEAIFPPEKVLATEQTPEYKFFNSGTLDNGLTYEDFVSDKGNTFSAVRYYFNGDQMVKVAMASFVRDGGKILSYEKSVVNITEFSTTPDQNYLKLPAELKDKAKH